MFARNVYKLIIRQNASEHEVVWVMKVSIILVGCVATYMALSVHSIYGLRYLSSDLVYVILFPQLVCVVHFKKHCNTYGSLSAYIVGLLLRGLGGEDILGLHPWIKYPFYDDEHGQLFPFRTFSMLSSFATLIAVSRLSKWIFLSGVLPSQYDYFHCVINIPEDVIVVQTRDPEHPEEQSAINMAVKTYKTSNGQVNPALDASDDVEVKEELLKHKTTGVTDSSQVVTRRSSIPPSVIPPKKPPRLAQLGVTTSNPNEVRVTEF